MTFGLLALTALGTKSLFGFRSLDIDFSGLCSNLRERLKTTGFEVLGFPGGVVLGSNGSKVTR
jgi:hypothetical protein